MKFNFNPNQEMSPVEKSSLQNFSENIKSACIKVPDCETCILKDLCDEQHVPDFIEAVFDRLGIF